LRGRFGKTKLAQIANGTDDDARLLGLEERGMLAGQSARYLMELLRGLDGAGLVETSRGEYPTMSLTRAGREVLEGAREIEGVSMMVSRPKRARARKAEVVVDDLDPELVERLRAARSHMAAERGVPAYVIFS